MGRHYIHEYLTPSDSDMGRHYIHEYLTPSEYNAYPYLNNNKVWPVLTRIIQSLYYAPAGRYIKR